MVKNAHATQSGVIHFVSEMWVGTSKVRERRLGDPGVESPGEGVIRAKVAQVMEASVKTSHTDASTNSSQSDGG